MMQEDKAAVSQPRVDRLQAALTQGVCSYNNLRIHYLLFAMSVQEGWHTADDGRKLYTKTWTPSSTEGPVKSRLVFIHGFSDHINTYGNFFPYLASKGIEVYSFDQR